MRIDRAQARFALKFVRKRPSALQGFIPAAVMMLLYDYGDETRIVYIRRTKDMTLHSGHIAFPGGKIDKNDESTYHAAVRETAEEIGVGTDQYSYLGEMGYFETVTSNHDAAAYLGFCLSPPRYDINFDEVEEVVEIPLEILYRQFDPFLDFNDRNTVRYLNFNYQPANLEVANLWGLTARITYHFLHALWQSFE